MRRPDWNCHYIETVDEAQGFLRWLGERRPILAVDCETTGLHPWTEDTLRLVQFGDARDGWAISYRNWRGLIETALRQYTGPVVGHNLPFDIAFLDASGLPLPQKHLRHDTMVMSHLIDPARSHGLKQRGDALVPGASAAQFDLKSAMTTNRWTWATIPEDFQAYHVYAASDTCLTAVLYEDMLPQLQARGLMGAYYRESAIQWIAYGMQKKGLRVDTEYTSNLLDEWMTEMEQVEDELHLLGVANPSAGQQVAAALQLTEDWEPDAWTETGLPKVDEKVLVGIDSDIARKVLRYRRLRKWCSAYLQRFLGGCDSNGYVHPNLSPLRARTGRWSIQGPALQTLPRGPEIRDAIIPDDGHSLWMIDYNGMEMVGLASYSGDPGLLAAIRGGEDLHTYVAREVYQDPTIDKDDPRRNLAKNAQFCKVYGGGNQKIADTAGVSLALAEQFTEVYNQRFPGVPTFLDEIDRVGRMRLAETGVGYVTSIGGRYLPCANTKIYALTNYLIQGGMADVLKMKMIDLDAAGFGDAMLLPVHDEVIFQFPEGDSTSAQEALAIMEDDQILKAPLTCEVSGPYDRWGSKYRKEHT